MRDCAGSYPKVHVRKFLEKDTGDSLGDRLFVSLFQPYSIVLLASRSTDGLARSGCFIDIFLANLCLMSRITMIQAQSMPQYLHTFLQSIHPTTASAKLSIYQRISASTLSSSDILARAISLSEADHECHHEREQPGGFGEGETQNSVREQLSPHAWIAGHTGDQRPENCSNTHTGTSKTDGSKTRTNVSASDGKGFGELGGKRTDGLRCEGGPEGVADLLTLEGLEGRFDGVVVLNGAAHA